MTFTSPFRLRFGGNDSALIGNGGLQYNNANLTTAINGIAGFPGTATVTGAASTGFTVTFTGASAGVDVSSLSFQNLSCGGCFGSIEETNHGGANDSFTLTYNGNTSVPIVNGTNYTAAGITAALTPILPAADGRHAAGVRRRQHQRPQQPGLRGQLRRHAGGDERARHARACTNSDRRDVRLRQRARQGRRGGQHGRHRHADREPLPDGHGARRRSRSRCGRRSPSRAARPTRTATR